MVIMEIPAMAPGTLSTLEHDWDPVVGGSSLPDRKAPLSTAADLTPV